MQPQNTAAKENSTKHDADQASSTSDSRAPEAKRAAWSCARWFRLDEPVSVSMGLVVKGGTWPRKLQ